MKNLLFLIALLFLLPPALPAASAPAPESADAAAFVGESMNSKALRRAERRMKKQERRLAKLEKKLEKLKKKLGEKEFSSTGLLVLAGGLLAVGIVLLALGLGLFGGLVVLGAAGVFIWWLIQYAQTF